MEEKNNKEFEEEYFNKYGSLESDDYSTSAKTWSMIFPLLLPHWILWDPAYMNGETARIFAKAGFTMVNEDRNFFEDDSIPDPCDAIVSK